MDAEERQRLFEALVEAGWTWRDGALYAPNETMWLDASEPWGESLRDFHERMAGRLGRIKNYLDSPASDEQAADSERALADVAGLVKVLGELLT